MSWIFSTKARDGFVYRSEDQRKRGRRRPPLSGAAGEEHATVSHRRRQNENQNPNHHAVTGDVDMRDAFVHLTEDDTHSDSEFDSISKPSNGSGRVATKPQHTSDTAIKAMSASPQQPRKRKSQTAAVSDAQGPASLLATDSTASSQAELVRHDSSTLAKVRVVTTQYRSVDLDGEQNFIKALSTKPVTLQQLIQEIKAVYAGLGMVEKKCIEMLAQQTAKPTTLTDKQWQAFIALHRTLLNEHVDFFSISHNPATKASGPDGADHELRSLPQRYSMPARLWRHGVHSFLEFMRHRLPASLDHMLSFIYLAYSTIGLLLETVPDLRETWIECLGDIARYRMAIEETDVRDRQVWCECARTWYDMAADLSPNTGRIQHHLAVLARPNIVQQLYLYSKSLVASIPFKNANESIPLLFIPVLDAVPAVKSRYPPVDSALVGAAAVLFLRKTVPEYQEYRRVFSSHLEGHITQIGSRFKTQGPEIAGSLFAMLMDSGKSDNKLWMMLDSHSRMLREQYCREQSKDPAHLPKDFIVQDQAMLRAHRDKYWSGPLTEDRIPAEPLLLQAEIATSEQVSSLAMSMLYDTIVTVTSQIGNRNIVPFMYMVLAYLLGLTWFPGASIYIERAIPWEQLVQFLNTVARSNNISFQVIQSDQFPRTFGGNGRQLPEEFVMRGLHVMPFFFPSDWFQVQVVDQDERFLENASHQGPRIERCLWAAVQLAKLDRWITYDEPTRQFQATDFARSLVLLRPGSQS